MKYAASIVVVLVALVLVFRRPFSPRWVLELQPGAGQLHVNVRKSDETNSRFETVIPGEWRQVGHTTITLENETTKIPGGEIEFADVTMLPGAFTIRFGGSVLHIQENQIHLE